jgi:hypothetical protein
MLTNHLRHPPCRFAYGREICERLLPPENVVVEHPDRTPCRRLRNQMQLILPALRPSACPHGRARSRHGRSDRHSFASDAANGESWIERQPRPYRSPRFLQRAEQRKRAGEMEMREGIIPVGFEAPA